MLPELRYPLEPIGTNTYLKNAVIEDEEEYEDEYELLHYSSSYSSSSSYWLFSALWLRSLSCWRLVLPDPQKLTIIDFKDRIN